MTTMLTTLDKVKKKLQIPSEDESQDDLLQLMVEAASQSIEAYCRRSFRLQEYTERRSGSSQAYLELKNYPIMDVSSVKVGGTLVTDAEILPEKGMLLRPGGVWASGIENVEVTYQAGYVLPADADHEDSVTLPRPLEVACIMYAMDLFKGSTAFESERIADYSVKYQVAKESGSLPPHIQALISPYVGRWAV
ncbi:phage head-tail connector protein [Paenibacillus sp. RUD330]|nr:phage head-tail connector protein [Paenibacillus sp. RUD330]